MKKATQSLWLVGIAVASKQASLWDNRYKQQTAKALQTPIVDSILYSNK